MDIDYLKRIVEAALLAAGHPLSLNQLNSLFADEEQPGHGPLREALAALEAEMEGRAVELREVGSGYRLQIRTNLMPVISQLWAEKPPRYSRALLETLAIIAYRQPITRGEIEQIRGVSVSSNILRTLQERDWIRVVGHRDMPGRPELIGTTKAFLDYFSLKSLDQLPTLAEIKDIDNLEPELELRSPESEPDSSNAENDADEENDAEENDAEDANAEVADRQQHDETIEDRKADEPSPDSKKKKIIGSKRPNEETRPRRRPSKTDNRKNPRNKTRIQKNRRTSEQAAEPSPAERLHKVLARAGLGSRRGLETRIEAGEIRVDGKTAEPGTTVGEGSRVEMDGRSWQVSAQPARHRTLIYHKPEGEVTTRSDPEGRRTVFDRLPRLDKGRWIAIGRLDLNTAGLLVLTTDGELANRMMHPAGQVDREYLCRIRGSVSEEQIEQLKRGVQLDDGPARFSDIVAGEITGGHSWYTVALMEGRYREVRRLWEAVGVQVARLKRVRFGPVFLPARVRSGHYEELTAADHRILREDVGLNSEPTELELAPNGRALAHPAGPERIIVRSRA